MAIGLGGKERSKARTIEHALLSRNHSGNIGQKLGVKILNAQGTCVTAGQFIVLLFEGLAHYS